MTRTIITLRARYASGDVPRPGELMAAPTGGTIYRITSVTTLRRSGEQPSACRYRLTCERLVAADVPPGAVIRPWRWGGCAPRLTAPQAASAPRMAPVVSKVAQRLPGRAQAQPEGGGDFGPALRRKAVRDRYGRLLREADVEVDEQAAGDPRYPNRRVRRARRVDPLDDLRRVGTIGRREVEAAADLRQYLERVAPSVAGAGLTRVGIAPHLCQPISDTHLRAARKLREAAVALGERLWHPVLWVCLGGTVRGYSAQWHVGTHRASRLVGDGLVRLGDHFYGRAA